MSLIDRDNPYQLEQLNHWRGIASAQTQVIWFLLGLAEWCRRQELQDAHTD